MITVTFEPKEIEMIVAICKRIDPYMIFTAGLLKRLTDAMKQTHEKEKPE